MTVELKLARCPGCQKVVRIPAAWLNATTRCKHCGSHLQVKKKAAAAPVLLAGAARNADGSLSDIAMATGSGAAYVFVRTGQTWTQEAYLKASNTEGAPDPNLPINVGRDNFGTVRQLIDAINDCKASPAGAK